MRFIRAKGDGVAEIRVSISLGGVGDVGRLFLLIPGMYTTIVELRASFI
jgi:hypothetical protein